MDAPSELFPFGLYSIHSTYSSPSEQTSGPSTACPPDRAPRSTRGPPRALSSSQTVGSHRFRKANRLRSRPVAKSHVECSYSPAVRRFDTQITRRTGGRPAAKASETGRPASGLWRHRMCVYHDFPAPTGRRTYNTKLRTLHSPQIGRALASGRPNGRPAALPGPSSHQRWYRTDFRRPTGSGAAHSPKATSRARTALQYDDLAHKSLGAQAAHRLPRLLKLVVQHLGFGCM